jgi:hypothetical protein
MVSQVRPAHPSVWCWKTTAHRTSQACISSRTSSIYGCMFVMLYPRPDTRGLIRVGLQHNNKNANINNNDNSINTRIACPAAAGELSRLLSVRARLACEGGQIQRCHRVWLDAAVAWSDMSAQHHVAWDSGRACQPMTQSHHPCTRGWHTSSHLKTTAHPLSGRHIQAR